MFAVVPTLPAQIIYITLTLLVHGCMRTPHLSITAVLHGESAVNASLSTYGKDAGRLRAEPLQPVQTINADPCRQVRACSAD